MMSGVNEAESMNRFSQLLRFLPGRWGFVAAATLLLAAVVFVKVARLGRLPVNTTTTFERCDLDLDGRCDDRDLDLFRHALGRCAGDSGYRRRADADRDGCVTEIDHQLLFAKVPTTDDKD